MEAPCLDGKAIEKEDRKDDPEDGKEAVGCSEDGCGEGQAGGHVEDADDNGERDGQGGEGCVVGVEFWAEEAEEEDEEGECGEEGGEPPVVKGVVVLQPGSGEDGKQSREVRHRHDWLSGVEFAARLRGGASPRLFTTWQGERMGSR